jgi:hypothetical protein
MPADASLIPGPYYNIIYTKISRETNIKQTRLKRLPVISREYFHKFVYFCFLFKNF